MIAAGYPGRHQEPALGPAARRPRHGGQLERLKALNCGVSASGFRWTSAARPDGLPVGPMFPRLVQSGIPLALHQDGVHITAHNPWFALHYATTGRNNIIIPPATEGQQINPGQQISREQAMHMFTRGAAWYLQPRGRPRLD